MYPDCLNDLVGITDKENDCLDDTVSNVSTIGLFVTQDSTYNNCRFQSGDTKCGVIRLLLDCREEAYRLITVDVGAVLSSKIQSKATSNYFIGQQGTAGYLSSTLVPANPFLTIKTEFRPGAYVNISKLVLMITPISSPVTVEMRVIRESDNVIVKTWSLTIASKSTAPKTVEAAIIPCDGDVYRVEYDYDSATMMVPSSDYHCGCGDKLKNAAGFIKENQSAAYGICLYVELGCELDATLCALLKNQEYRLVIGHMIRKKIIELALTKIYYRQDVNKWTLLTPEDMSAQIVVYQSEYNERLKWLSYQTNFEVDGFCLKCGNGIRKVNLLTGR